MTMSFSTRLCPTWSSMFVRMVCHQMCSSRQSSMNAFDNSSSDHSISCCTYPRHKTINCGLVGFSPILWLILAWKRSFSSSENEDKIGLILIISQNMDQLLGKVFMARLTKYSSFNFNSIDANYLINILTSLR